MCKFGPWKLDKIGLENLKKLGNLMMERKWQGAYSAAAGLLDLQTCKLAANRYPACWLLDRRDWLSLSVQQSGGSCFIGAL